MYRYLLLIFALAAGLAALLYFQPWISDDDADPRLIDRLPDGQIIGSSDILELSKTLSKTLFHYKIPLRDFLSPEFILSQGKNYGLDVQSTVYFFANHDKLELIDWGALIAVHDSSKVQDCLARFNNFVEITSSEFLSATIYHAAEYDTYMTYGNDWLFVYQGEDPTAALMRVISAKHNEISPNWRVFLNETSTIDQPIVAHYESPLLEEYGIASSLLSLSNDSSSLILHTVLTADTTLPFTIDTNGPKYYAQEFTRRLVNLHLNVTDEEINRANPVYKKLLKAGAKVNFPLDDFLHAWTGDLSFRQGGIQKIRESYIETEYDDDFNRVEVTKYRTVRISGFSLYLSMNQNTDHFLDKMLTRGILTQEELRYRLLFSPPLNMSRTDSSLVFHTGQYLPEMIEDNASSIMWTFDKVPVQFYLDSTEEKSLYGRIQLPLNKIVSDNLEP
ncbi:MAG: hypothetical protein QNK23_00470 [Crocinitomicaceae bacterium]|nr:hypothetical protein [Crocinitomicaceae bacterium]